MNDIELKPCPFCGGNAFMVQEGAHAECLTPGCCVGPVSGIDSWNTRSALTPPDGYALVPVEPTRQMQVAALEGEWNRATPAEVWAAMLAARPEVLP